jgi:uncharacterized membrane protein (DUF373 family)
MRPDVDQRLTTALRGFDRVLHIVMALALVVGSALLVWEFGAELVRTLRGGSLAGGFLHALGTLFLVWTLSSLISAELRYLQNGVLPVRVFIEVVIITLLRQLIVEPLQMAAGSHSLESSLSLWHFALLLAALLVVGALHWLVGNASMSAPGPADPARPGA